MSETLYASVLHLDRRAVKSLKITDPYSVHRVVYSLFEDIRSDPDKHGSTSSGIVYADQGGDFHSRKILILSNRLPAIPEKRECGRVESREIPPDFLNADRYRFTTTVNPCRRNNATGKLVPVKGRDAIAAWFCRRGQESWGFEVVENRLQVDRVEVLRFSGKNGRRITIARATLQGMLRVTDRPRFQQSFARGIGRGRAFGCGLLQIVPLAFNPFT
jgi:CRISPR system Cascade subunit CasE